MRALFSACSLVFCAAFAGSAAADPPDPGVRASTDLSGQLELARLVDLAAERCRIRVDYDAAALRTPVTVRAGEGLDDPALWRLMNQSLASRGLTTVRTTAGEDDLFAVVKLADAAGVARIEPGAPAGTAIDAMSKPTPGFASVVVKLERPLRGGGSVGDKDALESIRSLLSKPIGGGSGGGVCQPFGDSAIIVSDLTARLEQVLPMIALLDREELDVAVEQFSPKFVPAATLAPLVMQVAGKREAIASRRGTSVAAAAGSTAASPALAGLGEVMAAPTGGTLVLVAPRDALPQWRELIEQLDQRQPVETKTYTPRVFPAGEVARLIEQQVAIGSGGSPGSGASAGSAGLAPGGDERFKLIVDDLTGSLIITGTGAQHEQVAAILERLDSVETGAKPVRSFPIRNRPVDDVLATLTKLIQAGVLNATAEVDAPAGSNPLLPDPARGTAEHPVRATVAPSASVIGGNNVPGGGTGDARTRLGSAQDRRSDGRGIGRGTGAASGTASGSINAARLSLTADEGTNTLIAVGEPRLLSQLESLLKTIDVRQPQVMLEVMLVSLNDSDVRNLGVELERISTSNGITHRMSSLFGLSSPAVVAGEATRSVGDSAGFTGAVLNPGEFSVIVRALQSLSEGRQSSLPKVLVNNNEQAQFNSTLQQPVTTQRATDQTTTTSFAGFEDAGTKISIKPQIAEGDHLVLQYTLSLSSFVGAGTNGVPPPRQQNEVASIATIPDGHTVVVGGLELVTNGEGESRVPLIADVPIVGELFKNRSKNQSTSRFYVFIKATVLRDAGFEDLKYLSNIATRQADVDDGWPVVEPRVIK